MKRLTKRSKTGTAFDDDGALIRGAGGAFHQKKDMTANFIRQRFVALDKAIDRLAAYEDTMPLERAQELAQAEKDGRLSAMKTQLGYDAIAIDGMIKALREAEKVDVSPPPNDPLTLEELREMDGEPVWCINGNGGQWGLVDVSSVEGETRVECVTKTGFTMDEMTFGTMGIYAWLAYRCKPEEGEH